MITLKQAREIAEPYVAENRPFCTVSGFLEDNTDYLVCLETSLPEFPVGWEFIFVRKSDGQIWTKAPGDSEKMLGMNPV